jgi:hypothetical protein
MKQGTVLIIVVLIIAVSFTVSYFLGKDDGVNLAPPNAAKRNVDSKASEFLIDAGASQNTQDFVNYFYLTKGTQSSGSKADVFRKILLSKNG